MSQAQLNADLTALRTLINTSWTPGKLAQDAGGNAVDPSDPTATAWNLIGACRKVTGGDGPRMQALTSALRDATNGEGIVHFDIKPGRAHGEINSLISAALSPGNSGKLVGKNEKP